jgi:hypothetical protein
MHKSKLGGQRFCVVRAASKSFAEPSRSGFKAPLRASALLTCHKMTTDLT